MTTALAQHAEVDARAGKARARDGRESLGEDSMVKSPIACTVLSSYTAPKVSTAAPVEPLSPLEVSRPWSRRYTARKRICSRR